MTVVPDRRPQRPARAADARGPRGVRRHVKVRVPGVGVDRNGDPVTVTGITSAPRLGRIVSYGGNFLEYQAYPRTVGTDEFTYSVVDSQGAFATGTVRVAVVRARPAAAAAGGRGPAHRRAGADGDVRPAGQRLRRPRRRGRGRAARRAGRCRARPGDQPGDRAGARRRRGAPPVVIVYSVTNGLERVAGDDDAGDRRGLQQPAGRLRRLRARRRQRQRGGRRPRGCLRPRRRRRRTSTVTDVCGDPSATVVDGVAGPGRPRAGAQGPALRASRTATGRRPPPRSTSRRPAPACPTSCPDALIELDSGDSIDRQDLRLRRRARRAPRCAWRRVGAPTSASPTALTVGPDGDNRFALSAADGLPRPGRAPRGGHHRHATRAATRTPRPPTTARRCCCRSRSRSATTPRCSSAPRRSCRSPPASATTSTSPPSARSSPSTRATPPASTTRPSGARPSTASTSAAPTGSVVPVTAADDRHRRAARPC